MTLAIHILHAAEQSVLARNLVSIPVLKEASHQAALEVVPKELSRTQGHGLEGVQERVTDLRYLFEFTRSELCPWVAVYWHNCNNTATKPAGYLDAGEQSDDIFFSVPSTLMHC